MWKAFRAGSAFLAAEFVLFVQQSFFLPIEEGCDLFIKFNIVIAGHFIGLDRPLYQIEIGYFGCVGTNSDSGT